MMILPVLFLLEFATRCLGQTVQDTWVHPVLYENIVNGSKYDIIWSPDLVPLFADYCTKCDTFKVDLCVQPSSNRNVNITIGQGINVAETRQYSWIVNIPAAYIKQPDWVFRFIPSNGDCNDEEQQISSYSFYIEALATTTSVSTSIPGPASLPSTSSNDLSSSSASSSSTPSTLSAAPSTSTTTSLAASVSPSGTGLSTGADLEASTSSSGTGTGLSTGADLEASTSSSGTGTGLSTSAKAGIGAGIGLAALLFVTAGLLFIKSKRSRQHAKQSWVGQRIEPEKEIPSHPIGSYQEAADHGFNWSAQYGSASSPTKIGGGPVAQPAQELDSNVVSEVDGERRDR